MQRKVLPGLNWLFALGGLTLPLLSLAQIAFQLATDSQVNPAEWLSVLALGVTSVALLAAGLQLQGVEAPKTAKR
jgi:hypothetical protein